MAPVVKQSPTAVQMPPMSAEDKYKAYVRSNTNPSHQFDDNMKEPNNNNNNIDFKKPSINNNNNNFNNDAPQFFTCHTSYSCTPTVISSGQSNQKIIQSPGNTVQAEQRTGQAEQRTGLAEQGKPQPRFVAKNDQLSNIENGKPGPNAQFNNVMNNQHLHPNHQNKPLASSDPTQQTNQLNKLKNTECGKPAPHAQFNNVKNAPIIPSPLVMTTDLPPQQPPRQRKTSNPVLGDRPQGNFGLSHSRSSPSISSKGSSPSQNESLVLHYFQNPHTYKNLQERQLPGQGPVPKSMLPPPAPPADKRKSTSPRNSLNDRRGSVPKGEAGDGKNQDWSKMLTQFYQW